MNIPIETGEAGEVGSGMPLRSILGGTIINNSYKYLHYDVNGKQF